MSKYVKSDVCASRVRAIHKHMKDIQKDVQRMMEAMVGKDFRGGMVKDVNELKTKCADLVKAFENLNPSGGLSGKEKTAIVISLITSITSVIIVLVK